MNKLLVTVARRASEWTLARGGRPSALTSQVERVRETQGQTVK